MVKIDEIRYKADEGCFIVRNEDNYIMGEDICLGSADSIENYHDEKYNEEGYKAFYEGIGIDVGKKNEMKNGRTENRQRNK